MLVREPDQLGVERAHPQLAFGVRLVELAEPDRMGRRRVSCPLALALGVESDPKGSVESGRGGRVVRGGGAERVIGRVHNAVLRPTDPG